MFSQILTIVLCLFAPLLILWLTYRFTIFNKIGSIVLAYVFGCIIGFSGLIPNTEDTHQLLSNIASICVPFAIPLMLFSTDIKAWGHLAPAFIKSLISGLIACMCAAFVIYGFCSDANPMLYANVCGMLTGLYTGGTANLVSLKVALGISDDIYLQINTYDIAASALYLLFIMTIGKHILRWILPKFISTPNNTNISSNIAVGNNDNELFLGLFTRNNVPHLCKALMLSVIVITIGAGIAYLFPNNIFQSVFILVISVISVLASLLNRVRKVQRTFEAGTYFILIFSFTIALQVNTDIFSNLDASLFIITILIITFSILINIIFNALLRVDADTTLTTSVALICSPPFVPVIGSALKNNSVIGPGIVVGLCGYAIGTHLGFAVALILKLFI